ncbi:MAG TPA: ABC transporter permease [Chloroflexia bacterium]|jgi:ABC-2 type transport system permease protein|nr:ABC transporter permease [Chloroflexia bacterium]
MNSTLTQAPARRAAAPATLAPVAQFGLALLRAGLKNRVSLASSLLTPLFMLGIFWLVSGDNSSLLRFIFPGLVAFTVMLAGSNHAMRLVMWREQGVFTRLACTPVPVGRLALGAAGAQVALGLVQALIVMAFGVGVVGVPVDPLGALAAVGVLTLGGACFIAYGSLVGAVARRAEVATMLYIFTLLPLSFLGNTFMPLDQLPAFVRAAGPWLPTTMISDLVRPLLITGALPANAWLPLLGLLVYTGLFSALAARLFHWE